MGNVTLESTSRDSESICLPYHNKIVELLTKKSQVKYIYQEIQKEGYNGSYSMLKTYTLKIKKSDILTYKKVVQRKYIINLVYKKMKDNKNLDKEMLLIVYKKYPQVKKLLELMYEFKGILLNTKSNKALDKWFLKAEKLNIKELNSFINGSKADYDSICNALKYKYSNGVVEASVNKIKLMKRIMFGRCSFHMLTCKTLRLEFL